MITRCTCHPGLVPRNLTELCTWCQHLRLGDARIEAALANLGADHRPRAGWDANVLATARRRVARQQVAFAIVCTVAIAVVCTVAWWRENHRYRPLQLELRLEHGDLK